jgi:hypothetical protein
MNLTIIAAIIAASIGVGVGYKIASNAADAKELIAANAAREKYNVIELQYNAASGQLEAVLAAHRTTAKETTHTINKIVERSIYRNLCLDDSGLRAANAALSGTSSPR